MFFEKHSSSTQGSTLYASVAKLRQKVQAFKQPQDGTGARERERERERERKREGERERESESVNPRVGLWRSQSWGSSEMVPGKFEIRSEWTVYERLHGVPEASVLGSRGAWYGVCLGILLFWLSGCCSEHENLHDPHTSYVEI